MLAKTNLKSKANLFGIPNNEELNTECTNSDFSANDAIQDITIFNCEFKFQNTIHAHTVKQYEVWLDNLVQQ